MEPLPTLKPPASHRLAPWPAITLSVLVLLFFYLFVPRYGAEKTSSALGWLKSAWNSENDYEHGLIFPFLIAGLIIHGLKDLRSAIGRGSAWGLVIVLFGALCYAAAYRTLQPRVAVGALPILLWGSALYLWGWQVAKRLAFPLCFFWLAIPLPGFQQATNGLQHIATNLTHYFSALCGVQTIVRGTDILPVTGTWEPLSIAGGCSGIRSLMALLMISAAWAYIAKIAVWKKAILFLSAIPLAILFNALRVTSIFVIAEYGDPKWARETWHDWSGLLLFYPISLFLLLCLHAVLEGGLPWHSAQRRTLKRSVVNATATTARTATDSNATQP